MLTLKIFLVAIFLPPSTLIKRLGIALLATTVRWIEKLIEVKILQDFSRLFLILLGFLLLWLTRPILLSTTLLLFIRTDSLTDEIPICSPLKLGVL